MAITPAQRRAICRVYVPGTKSRGTAFVVADDLVLTAGHVVQRAKDEPTKPYAAADIELEFGNPAGQPLRVNGVKVEAFAQGVDAAVLRLPPGSQVGGEPFKLRVLSPGYLVEWETYGYSDAAESAGKLGQEYGGHIRTLDPQRYQLSVDQQWGSPAGLSGAPCIVAGQVVAMIQRTQNATAMETLFARPVSVIVTEAASAPLGALSVGSRIKAYVPEVSYMIGDFGELLEKTAVTLGLGADPDEVRSTTPREELQRRVAEEMMRGVVHALRGIQSLKTPLLDDAKREVPTDPPRKAQRIVEFATRTWIDENAIEELEHVLTAGDKIVVLNTENAEIANWYVHRAGCVAENAPGKFEYCSLLQAPSIEREALIAEFANTLAGRFNWPSDQLISELLEHDHVSRPIVLLLAPVPTRADLDYIRSRHDVYKTIRIILLVNMVDTEVPEAIRIDYPDAFVIKPSLVAEYATKALDDKVKAERQLRRIFGS